MQPGSWPKGGPRTSRPEAGGALAKLVTLLVVVAVIAGVAAFLGLLPGQTSSSTTPPDVRPGASGPAPSEPGLRLRRPAPAEAVLAGVDESASVSAAKLKRLVAAELTSPRLGKRLAFAVAPLGDPGGLWKVAASHVATPASTMKLLTCLAALQVLGPDRRFETTVERGTTPRRIVLVGGGDPLLTDDALTRQEAAASYPRPATLQELAARTATQLRRAGVRHVSIGYDDSLFTGPAVNPAWEPNYVAQSVVSPITALWVDEGRMASGLLPRVADPSRVAAERFAGLLSASGLRVDATVHRARAAKTSPPIASVESAPLAQIVQHVLELSDNEGAEVLLRQLAIAAGRTGSSAAGVQVVRQTLEGLGIGLAAAVMDDGSGLSRSDRLPVEALVEVLQAASDPDRPKLRTVVTSLPVAGFSGSLDYRFVDDAPSGLGVVRAKTGTLTGVHALAGVVLTRDSQALVFAAVADRVPVPRTLAARAQLDRIAATLAACGC